MASRSRSNLRLDEAIEAYLTRIANEGQAPASQKTARYGLARFRKAVTSTREPNPYVHTISAQHCDDYCFGLQGIRRGIGAISFNRYRSVLKVFFDYALMMHWVDVNPMDGIGMARPDAPKQKLLLNAGELVALLEVTGNPAERIACAIGMNTGLRANDVRHLTVFDASLASGTIQTEIRKTRKFDVKPITMELHRELIRWLDTYALLMGVRDRGQLENEWLLVPTYRRLAPKEVSVYPIADLRPLSPHTHPWRLVQRPLKALGYPTKGEGFHTLRRSSARALFESLRARGDGRDHALMIVKDFLNHASVVQTEHYLGLNQERTLRDALLKDQPFLTRLAEDEQSRVQDKPVGELRRGA